MSHLLRKFGRSRAEDLSGSGLGDDDALVPNSQPRRSDYQRSVSEPTAYVLPSIPFHIRSQYGVARNVSSADSRFPGASEADLPLSISGDDPAAAVDSLGLTLHYKPPEPDADFIFVHGLGGSSQKTWSFNRDIKNFWPLWLPSEPEFSRIRIFSFGYNANFRTTNTFQNITDFAKDLLFRMLTFTGPSREEPNIHIGQHPIVFVMHSMGGLVVKKAYILGKNDERYSSMMSQVRGMTFLATPHRGSNHAHTLNQILAASPFGASSKEYISQLETTSSTIQDINDQFRTTCSDLILVSFYETMKTTLGRGVKRTIVEKVSAVLDYPQEHSSPLNADHHSICKFENERDEKYMVVSNMLRLIVSKLPSRRPSQGPNQRRPSNYETIRRLEDILDIHEAPDQDFHICRSHISEGSCRWFTRKPSFHNWVNGSASDPSILWLIGPPATGKSTLASFVTEYLQHGFLKSSCQYHFFLFNHQTKRTVAYFLRSIAFQIAQNHEGVQDALFTLSQEANITFGQKSLTIIWEKIFEGIIFKTALGGEVFWVLDALDEADAAITISQLLLNARSVTPIKVFVTSRKTKDISNLLNVHSDRIIHENLAAEDTSADIEAYVSRAVRDGLPQDTDTQDMIIQQILTKASGSFLWVKLTLDTVRDSWHTQEDIKRAMMEVPEGMEFLYQRMLVNVVSQSDRNREIAQKILIWAVCSFRPLRLSELKAALLPDFDGFISLVDTIAQICGHFISVNNDQVMLVHATARNFLLSESDGFINKHDSHEHLALACLQYLSDENWKHVFALGPKGPSVADKTINMRLSQYDRDHPFLCYATEYWAYHVKNSPTLSDKVMDALDGFFLRFALVWIHAVALSGNLRTLIRTAQYLRAFTHRKNHTIGSHDGALSSLSIRDPEWIRSWAADLIRLVGKFGMILRQSPSSIYRVVPVLCPRESQIGGIYGRANDSTMSLSGLSASNWDDCLARVFVSEDETVSRILAVDSCFITLMRSCGKAAVWSAETCEELRRVSHGEYVMAIAVNKLSTILVTAGFKTIKAWEISSGNLLYSFPSHNDAKIMLAAFGGTDAELLIGRDDCSVQCYNLHSGDSLWGFLAVSIQDTYRYCPRLMSLSPDRSKLAIAERGKPVLIWDLAQSQDQQPWRCIHTEDLARHVKERESWNAAEIACWHPEGTSVLILYQDTTMLHWSFIDEERKKYSHIGAREMVISRDGNLLLTSDHNGTLSVWAFPRFNLVYRLFYDEFVRDMAFSPDGQRIYDCRGSLCNIWEPDVLIRHDEVGCDDASSIHNCSVLSDPVISQDNNSRSQITALVCDREDKYYCCGREDGSVAIHEAAGGKKLRKVYAHSSTVSVIALEWSQSGTYIVSGDDAGRVVCKRLEAKEPNKWAVFPLLDIRLREPVRQFLFHPDECMFLISTETMDIIWDIKAKTKRELVRKSWPLWSGRRWAAHPLDKTKLLWIDPGTTRIFEWSTLNCVSPEISGTSQALLSSPTRVRPQLHSTPSGTPEGIRWISSTRNGRYILCETLPNTGHERTTSARGMKLTLLSSDSRGSDVSQYASQRRPLDDIAAILSRFLGFFNDRVLFLDRMFWVCSWELNAPVKTVKKHFFLPRDWVSPTALQLVIFNSHGTLFCPRNGEVAIVRNGIKL